MIDQVAGRDALATLSPQRRAALIYGAAQAEMARGLWQAALGNGAGAGAGAGGATSPIGAPADQQPGALDALIAALVRDDPSLASPAAAPARRRAAADPAPAPDPISTAASAAVSAAAVSATAPAGLGANARYAPTLAAAAARTGIPAPALAAIVDAEAGKTRDGSWQVMSRNPRSSAAGLGQFLSRTWTGMAETRGSWLNAQAKERGWIGGDGHVVADARASLLAMRYDPTASINTIADYARANIAGIRRAGVTDDGDIGATARLAYLGHHLGLGDAIRFLRDGGLPAGRARTLLDAQVGAAASHDRIDAAGNASTAHRDWLLGYLDRKVRPDRFASA